MTNNIKIKKGDTVKILYGKERGRRGPVVAIDPKKGKIIVEGLNLYKRHLKGDGKTRTSEILTIEKPFPVSKVMLVCPLCDKATRVEVRKEGKDKVRVCKRCGKDIVKEEIKEKKTKKEPVKKTTKKTTEKVTEKAKKKTKKVTNTKVKKDKK
jgi:large subunit ribosomal protein L24